MSNFNDNATRDCVVKLQRCDFELKKIRLNCTLTTKDGQTTLCNITQSTTNPNSFSIHIKRKRCEKDEDMLPEAKFIAIEEKEPIGILSTNCICIFIVTYIYFEFQSQERFILDVLKEKIHSMMRMSKR